jgi:hypothetical protein
MVLDLAGDEHDPLAQQPRIDVEAALAAFDCSITIGTRAAEIS